MELTLLDVRRNKLTSFLSMGKGFKNTVVLAWDNQLQKSAIDQHLSKPKILSGSEINFNPSIIITPTDAQMELVEQI